MNKSFVFIHITGSVTSNRDTVTARKVTGYAAPFRGRNRNLVTEASR
jgi:hypothetical protein